MFRTLACLTLAGGLVLSPTIAAAESDRAPSDRAPSDRVADTRTDAITDRHPDRQQRDLRFECKARRTDRGPAIGCIWTPVGEDRAAGYRLLRAVDRNPRTVVFETRDNRQHAYGELVRPGHTYRYAVQYVAEDGTVLHTSHVVKITIPGRDRAAAKSQD